jgi:hypothetical protein
LKLRLNDIYKTQTLLKSKSKTLSITINRDSSAVYEYVLNPENLPKWAKMFCRSVKQSDSGEWIAQTQQGLMKLSIAKRNNFGVLDHHLSKYSGVEVFIPLRVMQNSNNESEMIFVGSNAL